MSISNQVLMLKLAAGAALGIAVLLSVFVLLAHRRGLLFSLWSRYLDFLDRRLRLLYSDVAPKHVALGQLGALAALAGLVLLFEIPYQGLLLAGIALGPWAYLERLRRKRLKEIEKQLDSFILALANALKSIPGISAAFQSVAQVVSSPMREELQLCNREMRVGSSLDEALLHMAARVNSPRLDCALSAVLIGRKIGGNLPRVLESTAASIREMERLEGVVHAKTSEAKLQLYVIGAAPFFLIVVLSYMSPGYFIPLQEDSLGHLIGLSAGVCWFLAVVLARRVLSVSL